MVWRVVREVSLTLAALAGITCVTVVVLGIVWGIRPLIFASDSMAPRMPVGALALARPVAASDLRLDDVVSVERGVGGRVTHRIVAIEPDGKQSVLTLKGDANAEPDQMRYRVSGADRVFWSMPGLGRVVAQLGEPPFIFGAGAIMGCWVGWWLPKKTNSAKRKEGSTLEPPTSSTEGIRHASPL